MFCGEHLDFLGQLGIFEGVCNPILEVISLEMENQAFKVNGFYFVQEFIEASGALSGWLADGFVEIESFFVA